MFDKTYGIGGDGPVRGAKAQGALNGLPRGYSASHRSAGHPSPGPQPRKEGTCHTKIPRKNAHAGGGGMNALPPSGLPAACVRGAGRRGPRPIGPCAGTAAKSVARPSAQDARRPRRLAYHTAAETRNGAARLRVTGAGGAIGHGRTLARARAAAHIHPLKAARCANRATWDGVTGSGNNMPRGVPPVCAAGAVRRRPVMPRAATVAPGARPNAQEKRRRIQETASATPGGAHGGYA